MGRQTLSGSEVCAKRVFRDERYRAGRVRSHLQQRRGGRLGQRGQAGILGRITTAPTGDVFEVDWSGRQLGKTTVKHFQVRKCKETEYFVTKDVVKAAFDLTYSSVAGDA